MIYFDSIMTLIESFVLAYFSFRILKIHHKKIIMLVTSLINFCEIIIFNEYILNNFLLLILLIITDFMIIYFIKKEFDLYNFIIPSILIALLLFSNTVSLFLISLISETNPESIVMNNDLVIILSIISRILFIIFCILFNYIENKFKLQRNIVLKKEYWIVFCIFTFSFLGVYTTLYESVFYNIIDNEAIYKMLFQFIILIFSFFTLYFCMQKEYYNSFLINNELIKSHYAEETYKKVNIISYQILQNKHQMFYILIKIKNLINNENFSEATLLIDKTLKKYKSFEMGQTMNIPTFDNNILNYIDLLKRNGYNITSLITIKNNLFLQNTKVITILRECIEKVEEYASDTKEFSIYMYANDNYLITKITTPKKDKLLLLPQIDDLNFVRKMDIINNSENEIQVRILFNICENN